MQKILFLIFCVVLSSCATLSERYQPSLNEPYGVIKSKNGIFFENIDEKHFGLGIYGYGGDVRLSPGDHILGMHFDEAKGFVHMTGNKASFPIHIEEGKRYYIGVEMLNQNFFGGSWKPIILKVEDIQGYVKKSNLI